MIIRKTICILLALITAASFSSCKNKSISENDTSDSRTNQLQHSFQKYFEETDISDSDLMYADPVAVYNDKYYYTLSGILNESEKEICGYTLDLDSMEILSDDFDHYSAENIIYKDTETIIFFTSDDEKYTLHKTSLNDNSDITADIAGYPAYKGTDGNGNIYLCDAGKLQIFDNKLNITKETDISSQLKNLSSEKYYIYGMTVTDDGQVFFVIGVKYEKYTIYKLDDDSLVQLSKPITDLEDPVSGFYTDKSGNIVLCTGYGSVFTNVVDRNSGTLLKRYDNSNIVRVIGTSKKHDLIYLSTDGIYGYNFENDTNSVLVSEEQIPDLSKNFEGSMINGNFLYMSFTLTGSDKLIEINSETGETKHFNCREISDACISDNGTIFYLNTDIRLKSTDENELHENSTSSVYKLETDGSSGVVFSLSDDKSEYTAFAIEIDENDNFYFLSRNQSDSIIVYKYDASGNLLSEITIPENDNCLNAYLVKNPSHDFFIITDTNNIYKIDKETNKLIKCGTIDSYTYGCYNGNSGYDFYFQNASGLLGWKETDNTHDEIVKWADVSGESCKSGKMIILNPDEILCSNGKKLIRADSKRLDELNSKTIITLAVHGADSIRSEVDSFNSKNDDIQIKIADYMETDPSKTSYFDNTVSEQMTKDILSGNIPDIIMFDGMNLSSMIEKNIFADLFEIADRDPDIDFSDFYENVLDEFTHNKKMFALPCMFTCRTMGSVSEFDSFDYNTILSLDKGEQDALFEYCSSSRDSLESLLLNSYLKDYVDLEKKKCDFENDTFKKLLKFIKEYSYFNNGSSSVSEDDFNRSFVLKTFTINNITEFYYNTQTDNLGYSTPFITGFPSVSGGTNFIYPFMTFGICEKSQNKDAAWKFIKYFLSDEFYSESENKYPSIPSIRISLTEEKNFSTINEFNKNSSFSGDTITTDMSERFNNILKMPVYSDVKYRDIMNMVLEETAKYYFDTATAEEVSKNLSNKVPMYLNEIS